MKILIAEDDPFTRAALVEIVRQEGWDPVPAEDGRKAWTLFCEGEFDLVCLDIMMPGTSGYDLCRQMREKNKSVAILFISAKAEEMDRVLGLELGADDFIVKPFGVREVTARLRAVLRRQNRFPQETPETGVFSFGPWDIDPQAFRGKSPRGEVDLTPREVNLLRHLWLNRGKVVSRQSLFEHCWGWDQAPQSRTLDQHIAVLRKKLESVPETPTLILTVQGVGYRYEEPT